ncbi:glycosyltransferase family 2 protein [Paramicrobacterium chengjingii]|uniref:Glycosyltransferase family 2 protein n=1 Tax=Paramicrobacterium chengjingii TaxID=2769067 RepID=A0ABX6YFA9_9MICO|nr:glycosyltransferase family 2 protein [Microbacterium chengjingii]QPZ37464.1 glycosyltransferase family 2 protein [Microbacterium chengjingii]
MPRRHVAIVMPAYNEADGLDSFLTEIVTHVSPVVEQLSIVVVNDRSTDETADLLARLGEMMPELIGITSVRNQGHGPTALAAYRAGLELNPDVIMHVDGDGQFLAADFPRLIDAHQQRGADVLHGVRRGRTDPWYRRAITALVGSAVALAVGSRVPDVNTPLRIYRPEALRFLLNLIPRDAIVPHVHFSLAEKRSGMKVAYARVRSIPRRGDSAHGTMWGPQRSTPVLPPKRLRSFIAAAAREVWTVSLHPGAPARRGGVFSS